MASRGCKYPADIFFYVCGLYVGPKHVSYKIVPGNKYYIAYDFYFGMAIGDQDKSWAPHVICGSCKSTLEGWLRGQKRAMPFGVPRIWREPTNYYDDCYFCMTDITEYRKAKGRSGIPYPNIPSSIAPVPHDETLPIPKPPLNVSINIKYFTIKYPLENVGQYLYIVVNGYIIILI